MNATARRLAAMLLLLGLLAIPLAGQVSANITAKTINTTPCATPNGCAVYSDPGGFSGTISGTANSTANVVDYICVGIIGEQFKPYAGTYTFKVYDGATLLASTTTEIVAGSPDCTGNNNAATGGVTFTFPASGVVNYTLAITGITASNVGSICPEGCHTIRNRAFNTTDGSHADSASVGVVGGPGTVVPEAPFASLLVVTGGLIAAAIVYRRLRGNRNLSRAA
jgi:hypothetical protein